MITVTVFNEGLRFLEYDPSTVTVIGLTDDDDLTQGDFDGIDEALSNAAADFPFQPETWYKFNLEWKDGNQDTLICKHIEAYSKGTE